MADNMRPAGWSQCSKEALNAAVDIFCSFIAQPDRAAVERWVLENAKPSEIYLKRASARDSGFDWLEAFVNLYQNDSEAEAEEEVDKFLMEFVRQFLPNTQEWFDFRVDYEGFGRFISFYGRSLKLMIGKFHVGWDAYEKYLLEEVLDCWKFDYSYGIWMGNEGPREGPLLIPYSCDTEFFGRGRWKFSDLLTHLDEYTREWFAAHGGPEKEYAELLCLMEEKHLEIELEFVDGLFDGGATYEFGRLYSDGAALHYRRGGVRPVKAEL